jgi:hypothetical protein
MYRKYSGLWAKEGRLASTSFRKSTIPLEVQAEPGLLLLAVEVGRYYFVVNAHAVSFCHGQNPILGRGLIGNWIFRGLGREGVSSLWGDNSMHPGGL